MKISLLQPKIERGNIKNNISHIQNLIDKSKGELLVLPEYCFTGSLVLDHGADISKWAVESDLAKKKLKIPDGKVLLANSLVKIDDSEFILFIYHFTKEHYEDTMKKLKELVNQRKVPVLVSSLVSDKNNGFSTYINKDMIISMPDSEGILEVEL